MSTLAVGARPRRDPRLRPLPWRRMAWVIWRQHRFAVTSLAALLGALAVCLWLLGLPLHHAYAAAAACRPQSSSACANLASSFAGMDRVLADGYVLQVVPALVGAFVGAPLLARELETGTFRYVWTQGLGRWRWTLAKLVALAVVVVVAAAAFTLLLSWYYEPYFATGDRNLSFYDISPLSGGLFDLRGVAFAAWMLAAFAIGCLAGVLIRRVVPAILATLGAYAGLALATGLFLRERYMTPLVTNHLQLVEGPKISPLGTKWILSQSYTKGGHAVGQAAIERFLRTAPMGNLEKGFDATRYLLQHGYTVWTHYQPASRFWSFQWIEGGWLFALSLLLLGATLWLVRRRPA
ncbi:MAG: ABC transporter permease subunit [Solirubrobacteraceae bacterium]